MQYTLPVLYMSSDIMENKKLATSWDLVYSHLFRPLTVHNYQICSINMPAAMHFTGAIHVAW